MGCERENARRREEKVRGVRGVDIERMCLFERHQGRLLYIDGACRRELNKWDGLIGFRDIGEE